MFYSNCVRLRTVKWNRCVRSQRRDVRNFRLFNILRGRRIGRSRKTVRKWLQPQWMASPLQLMIACRCRCHDARTTKLVFPSWILRHGKDCSKTSCLSTAIGRRIPSIINNAHSVRRLCRVTKLLRFKPPSVHHRQKILLHSHASLDYGWPQCRNHQVDEGRARSLASNFALTIWKMWASPHNLLVHGVHVITSCSQISRYSRLEC